MIERDAFDRRLADALRDYAFEAPTEIDPLDLARSVARGHPRRLGWSASLGGQRRIAAWVLLGIALLIASVIALVAAGSLRTNQDDLSVDTVKTTADLEGDWETKFDAARPAFPIGVYTLNVTAPVLISDAVGPLEWVGRVTRLAPLVPDAWELDVMSSGTCGDGRYVVRRYGVDGIRFTKSFDTCANRVAILVGALVWQRPLVTTPIPLRTGETYGSWAFSEPFHFVMFKSGQGPEPGDVAGFARQWGALGALQISYGCCWNTWFLDDQAVNADVCNQSGGTLPDVPATPEAVGEWLRSSPALTVSDPIEVPVDGRIALRYDIVATEECVGFTPPLTAPSIFVGHRLYAIPTGDDTILYVVWGDKGSLPSLLPGADELVRSMTFD